MDAQQQQPQEPTTGAQLPPEVTQIVTQSYADDNDEDGYAFVIINITPEDALEVLRRMDFVKSMGHEVSYVSYDDGTPEFIEGTDENEHVWALTKPSDMAVLRGAERLDLRQEDNSAQPWALGTYEAHIFNDSVVYHGIYKHANGSAYTPSIAREVFAEIAGEAAGATVSVTMLTAQERLKLRALLEAHFPELLTDEDLNGGDAVDELSRLFESLAPGRPLTGATPIGWQIVHRETDDPPDSQTTFEIYTLAFALDWLNNNAEERALWRLLPIYEGDVEEPVFVENAAEGREQ